MTDKIPHSNPIPVTLNFQTPWGLSSTIVTLYGPPHQEPCRNISDYSTDELLLEITNRIRNTVDDPPDPDWHDETDCT